MKTNCCEQTLAILGKPSIKYSINHNVREHEKKVQQVRERQMKPRKIKPQRQQAMTPSPSPKYMYAEDQ
jgi:hypothetical protein